MYRSKIFFSSNKYLLRNLALVLHPEVHRSRREHLVQLDQQLREDVRVEVRADLAEEEPLAHAQLVSDTVHDQVARKVVGAGVEGGLT